MKNLKKVCFITGSMLAIWVAISSCVMNTYADDIVPYTFTPGTTISANQVNQNFQALSNATPRTKNAAGGNATLTSAYQDLAALTITPKDDGLVMLLGNASVTLTQGSSAGGESWGTSTATICISRTSGGGPGTPDTNCFPVMLDTPYISNIGNYAPRITLPVNLVGSTPVIKDASITFYLTAARDSWSVGSSTVNSSSLAAIFLRSGM